MTADEFQVWLDDMKRAGRASSDAGCGRLIGLSAAAVVGIKKRGTDKRTAMACRAALHGLSPYDLNHRS